MPEHDIRLLVVAAREYSDTIQYFLRDEAIAVTAVDRADQLVDAIQRARPTVVVVDCVTPQMNGQAVFRWLRTDGGAREVPALLITVGRSQHRVRDDEATAPVDYVDVPMRQADFVARAKALHAGSGGRPAPLPVAAPDRSGRASKTIMIVEDDEDHSNLMRNLLEAEGYKTLQSSNLDAFKTAIVKKPDVLVLDLMMPVMDGFVLAEVFKACRLTRHIPIIFLTALHEAQYVEASRGLQAAAFLTKPVTIANFLFTIDMVLGNQARTA
jgi:DNA-binding response OmpR family regulator